MEEEKRKKHNETMKKWRENNKEKVASYRKKYYNNNKEKQKEYQMKYIENNKEKVNEYRKKYYINNKEKLLEYDKKWRENNKEQYRQLCYKSRRKIAEQRKQNGEKYAWYGGKEREELCKKSKIRRMKLKMKLAKYSSGVSIRKNDDGIIQIQFQPQKHYVTLYHGYEVRTKKYLLWYYEKDNKETEKIFINDKIVIGNILDYISNLKELNEIEKENDNENR